MNAIISGIVGLIWVTIAVVILILSFLGGDILAASLKDFENQLFIHMADVEGADTAKKNKALKTITEGLLQLVPILNKQPYLLYDEYSMLDVAMAPLLWRLDHYGIKLPASAKPLMKYADSLFSRPLFDEAMTPAEKAMR
jgi:RNA polymerase-associated protein